MWIIEYVTCIYNIDTSLSLRPLFCKCLTLCIATFWPEILLALCFRQPRHRAREKVSKTWRWEKNFHWEAKPSISEVQDLVVEFWGKMFSRLIHLNWHVGGQTAYEAFYIVRSTHIAECVYLANLLDVKYYKDLWHVWEGSTLIFEFSRLNIDNLILPPPLPNMRIFGGTRKTCCCLVYMPVCETSPLRY